MKRPKIPVVLSAAIASMQTENNHGHAPEPGRNRVEEAFKDSYVHRTFLKDDAMTCSYADGIFTLQGTVSDDAHRILAQEMAACLPGVERVDNTLTTVPDDDAAAKATTGLAAEHSDRWIARKLRLALLFHRNVSATMTGIAVKDGIVTLTGASTSSAQCDLTSAYAMDIDGVKGVLNDMTVTRASPRDARSAHVRLDDASITAQIRTALLLHRSTCALSAKVAVFDGEVDLTVIAANDAEVSLVGKLVTDIHGVIVVRNRMTAGPQADA